MNQNDTHKIPKSAYLLLPVMALAFYIAFIPHVNYPYPVHIDEWLHMTYSEAMLEAGSTTFTDPFSGAGVISLSTNLETSFQLFWGVFQSISGIPWLPIFRYFPGIILALTALAVYLMARREGFGWEAALFAGLVPTTVGILGPAFLVPVALGLFFVSLSLFIAFNFTGIRGYITLFIFTCFLVAIHAPSAICLVIILVPYILLNLKGNFKHSLGLGLALAVPFLAPFPWIFDMLLPTARQLFTPQALPDYVDFPQVVKTFGYLPAGLCILGTLVLAIKGGRKYYGLVLGLLLLLVMLVTFCIFHYGVSIIYERGLIFMMLMVGIMAGAGLAAVKNFRLPEIIRAKARIPAPAVRYLGWAFCLVLVGVTLFTTIPDRQDTDYYHMIEDEQYQAFVWIRDNLGASYDRAILDPWLGTPFTAITGKTVYARIHSYPMPRDLETRSFLEEGCTDTEFLRAEGISIVYTDLECRNPDLTEVRENVYLLKKTDSG